MKIINPIILNAHFINRNCPRSLLQANAQYGGMNVTHLYDVMGIEKVKFLLMHMRRYGTTGKLFHIAMQHIQLECGTEKLFFNLCYETYSSLTTRNWLTHLWEYFDTRAIQADLALEVVYKKPRENDVFLMDLIIDSGQFTLQEIVSINKVRQHYNLLTLSDIVDLRGRRLIKTVKDGKIERISKFSFRKQDP